MADLARYEWQNTAYPPQTAHSQNPSDSAKCRPPNRLSFLCKILIRQLICPPWALQPRPKTSGALRFRQAYPAFAFASTACACTGEDFRAPGPGCTCTAFAESGSPHSEQIITGSNMCPQFLCWCSIGRPRESTMWISPQCTIDMMIG